MLGSRSVTLIIDMISIENISDEENLGQQRKEIVERLLEEKKNVEKAFLDNAHDSTHISARIFTASFTS